MKTTFKKIAEMMHYSCPDESFAIEFWDGDRISFGKAPIEYLLGKRLPLHCA
ncbi:MAG: hypothetical protein JRJ76_15150 [Deltaproteobacteria bacterium]|nr:hypothetical protein [Deltaproteobacteria bacterium]